LKNGLFTVDFRGRKRGYLLGRGFALNPIPGGADSGEDRGRDPAAGRYFAGSDRGAVRPDPDVRLVQQTIAQQIEAAHGELGDVDNQTKPQLLSYYGSPARRRPLFPSAASAGGARALELLRDFLGSEREKAMAEVEEE
jgi:hypothetical protein